jgi:hypothetical protein
LRHNHVVALGDRQEVVHFNELNLGCDKPLHYVLWDALR